MHLTYNNQALCDDFGLRIHLHTDIHNHMASTPTTISPFSLPRALHTAASELPQMPDTLDRHSTPLIRTFWPIIVMLIILYPFIQLLLNVFIQSNPKTHDPVAYYSVRTRWVQSRASHICSLLHLTIQHIPPPPILDKPQEQGMDNLPLPLTTTCLHPHPSAWSNPNSKCTHYKLSRWKKQAHFLHNTAHVVNVQIHDILYMSVIFFVIKIWTVEFILSHWNHRHRFILT